MKFVKQALLAALGLFALLIVLAILFPGDPIAPEQKRACQRINITSDANIWSPVACNLTRYKAMLQSTCSQVYSELFDRLACFVPIKSEYAKKREEDAGTQSRP